MPAKTLEEEIKGMMRIIDNAIKFGADETTFRKFKRAGGCGFPPPKMSYEETQKNVESIIRHVYASACERVAEKIPLPEYSWCGQSNPKDCICDPALKARCKALDECRQIALEEARKAREGE